MAPTKPGLSGWLRCMYTAIGREQQQQQQQEAVLSAAAAAAGNLLPRDKSNNKRPLVLLTRAERQAGELLEVLAGGPREEQEGALGGLSVTPSADGRFDVLSLPLIETVNEGDKQQQQRLLLGQLLAAAAANPSGGPTGGPPWYKQAPRGP